MLEGFSIPVHTLEVILLRGPLFYWELCRDDRGPIVVGVVVMIDVDH